MSIIGEMWEEGVYHLKEQHRQELETVHFNTFQATVIACANQWNILPKDNKEGTQYELRLVYPPMPPLNKIKKV